MPTVSLFNPNTFVFLAVVILGVIIISVYMILIPEQTVPYNFDPFPKVAPTALPDPARAQDSCWNKLVSCDPSKPNQCSSCSGGEMSYECKTIKKGDTTHSFNSITVPEGSWCIPKDQNPEPICNAYTGRWLWTYDPEYCGKTAGSTQCWKCDCLYPSLFAGSETGCVVPLACQNTSPETISEHQPNNKLIASDCAPTAIRGKVWDPTVEDDSGVLQYSPYDTDEKGNPLFVCNCADNSNGQYFKRLPGDPLTCHLEPCYKYVKSTYPGDALSCVGNNCNQTCTHCNCTTGFDISPSGKYKNTCVLISGACGGTAGYGNGACICDQVTSWERKCRSPATGVNMDNPSLPECKLPQNALGSECYNPCAEAKCNGATCISCGPLSYKSLEICKLGVSEDGKELEMLKDPSVIHHVCDCSSKPSPLPGFDGWSGPSCSDGCFGAGKQTWSSLNGDYMPCSKCCSMSYKYTESSFGGSMYSYDACNGGYPSTDQPIDPTCTPFTEGE